jgi:hypothetical protein
MASSITPCEAGKSRKGHGCKEIAPTPQKPNS